MGLKKETENAVSLLAMLPDPFKKPVTTLHGLALKCLTDCSLPVAWVSFNPCDVLLSFFFLAEALYRG